MKNITEFINEARHGDWFCEEAPFCWKADAAFISVNPDERVYGFLSEKDIEDWASEYDTDAETIKRVLKLKPGEGYSPDDINFYIRIKK